MSIKNILHMGPFIAGLLILASCTGLSSSEVTSSSPSSSITTEVEFNGKYRTFYQILVYSYADSNNDGVGDFKGIADKLPYLKGLGVDGIWLSPSNPAMSYHSYNVLDYYDIRTQYEVNGYTYEDFIAECTAEGIVIIMDLVINHTGLNHPWFLEGLGAFMDNTNSPYKTFYNFSNTYSKKCSSSTLGVYYEAIFGSNMPDLNFDDQGVRDEIINVAKYWLAKGVAGFRLDAAMHIFTDYSVADKWNGDIYDKNVAWWNEFQSSLAADYPNVYLTGEIWTAQTKIEKYYASNLDSAFAFETSNKVKAAINGQGGYGYWLENFQSNIRTYQADGIEALFLSNHDVGRFTANYTSLIRLKMAAALQVLAPGNAFVYYGDEAGLKGNGGSGDAMYRTPMMWDTATTTKPGNYGIGSQYYSTSVLSQTPTQQAADINSLYSYYSQAIALKKANQEIFVGVVKNIPTSTNYQQAYTVTSLGVTSLIIHNTNATAVSISLTGTTSTLSGALSTSSELVSLEGTTLTMPSYSSAVIRLGSSTVTIASI